MHVGTSWNLILKVLKCRNEIYQRLELKEMQKMESFVYLSCFLIELWSLKCQKWLFFAFPIDDSKNQSQFGKNIEVHLKDLI